MSSEGYQPDIEPEATRAERHRLNIASALEIVVIAMEDARREGFFTEFNCGLNQFGRYSVQHVGMLKRF